MIELNISKSIFNDKYLPYINDYSHKFEIYYGGAGSGKSVFIALKLIAKACNDKRRILVVRKTGVSLKESCWRLLLDILSKWKLYPYCKINKSDFTIELPNGSIFLLKGLDDPEKIKSILGITDCWIEEATELNIEDFDQLKLRLRERVDNTLFFLSFNPVSKANWVYKRWFSPDAIIDKDTFILKTTYKDNKFLTQDYIDTLEAQINVNPTYYKIYALGEFATLDKLVYPFYTEGEPPENANELELLLGLDFGYSNDPTAFIAAYLDRNKLYIFDEHYLTGMLNSLIAEMIKYKGFAKSNIIADSAEPKSIEEIKRCGIIRIQPAVKGKDSILQGILKILQYELIVSNKCPNVKVELENYSWEKGKQSGEYTNRPVDAFNHLLDALRYALLTQKKKIRVSSVAL